MNDFWEYDVEERTWREIQKPDIVPGIRHHQAMAYGGDLKILVQGGGYYPGGRDSDGQTKQIMRNDLWEFDIITGSWRELSPKGDRPLKTSAHAMEYLGNNKVLLHNGREFWIFDREMNTWELR
jgi:N-acetylneuraminic acid mutarotase